MRIKYKNKTSTGPATTGQGSQLLGGSDRKSTNSKPVWTRVEGQQYISKTLAQNFKQSKKQKQNKNPNPQNKKQTNKKPKHF